MNYIESEEQYQAAMARIEELLPIVKEDTPEDDENYLELVRLSYMVADCFKKVRKRDPELDSFVRGTICPSHQFVSTDGKRHSVKCMDLQSILRLVQSIPSKKVEPIKHWLAEVGAV